MNNDATSSGQSAGGTAQSLKDDAVALKDKAASRLASEADSRKGDVAGGMKQVSSALDAASSQLDGGETPDWLKQGFAKVASTVNSLATELERTDSSQLTSKLQQFARQRPGTFLSACGAVGFAAARVFMAGQSSGSGDMSKSSQTFGRTGDSTMGSTGGSASRPYGQDSSYGAGGTGGVGGTAPATMGGASAGNPGQSL